MRSIPEVAVQQQDSRAVQTHLLWIDDEVSPSDVQVRFLEREGFRVRCAVTGTAGLAMARTGRYQGIVLDLRLPDIPGLAVLATLRAEAIGTPVLVLTGFGDVESALVAGRFGAAGFATKPLFVDDLKAALQRLIEGTPPEEETFAVHAAEAVPREIRARFKSLATLLEGLHRLARESVVDGVPGTNHCPEAPRRHRIRRTLIEALANPVLPMAAFMACAAALRRTMTADATVGDLAADAESFILETLGKPAPSDPRVIAAIDEVEAAAARHERLKIEEIAKMRRIDPSHLGRLIKEETGFWFTDWRTAFLLRPSLSPLVNTTEDVKQIVRRALGFKDPSQFDHEFQRFFGLSPTEFREF